MSFLLAHTRPCWPHRIGWPALLLAAWLLSGCAGFVPQPGPGPEPAGQYVALTLPLLAVGDSQEHESTGYPLHDNDSAVDAYIEVAQRPPEQPLFGRRILQWALKSEPQAPFLHLGDVMDLSCRSEAERIGRIFEAAGRPGTVLPGNHDGLMFGIYGYRILDAVLDPDAQRWQRACRRGTTSRQAGGVADPPGERGHALSKRDFIALVLKQLQQGGAAGLPQPAPHGEQRISWRHPDAQAFVSAVEARLLDGVAYADSFLAQRLLLPGAPGAPRRVWVVALDTNQAGALVGTWDTLMGRSPGSMGHVHLNQVAAVTPWVLEAARNDDIVVFAGHHNWASLGLASRMLLRNLMSNLRHPLVYLSAHTHRGFWAEHRVLDRRPLLELNVSSLSDWPVAWRRVRFAWDARAERLLVQADLMPQGPKPATSDAELLATWKQQACRGLPLRTQALEQTDRGLVQRQRQSRGSLWQWALSALGPLCERCEAPLYEHAHAYQDAMLDAVLELAGDLGEGAHQLHTLALPAWCGGANFIDCAERLKAERPEGFEAQVLSFRRKATLVDLLGGHLDDLDDPQAAAYMTCRAVLAAELDFNATDDSANNHRGEHKRRAEQFFRTEASVGLD